MRINKALPHNYSHITNTAPQTNPKNLGFRGIEVEVAKGAEQVSKSILKTTANMLKPVFKPIGDGLKFTGDFLVNAIGIGLKKLGSTKPIQKLSEKLSKSLKFSRTHLMVADSIIISSFYMINTAKNKNIDKKQKPQMIINDALVLTASTACSYLLDGKINKVIDKFVDIFRTVNKDLDPKKLNSYQDGIKAFKSVVILGLIYRYVSPVLFTPVANKLSAMLQNKKGKNDKEKAVEQNHIQNTNPASTSLHLDQAKPTAFKAFK